MYYKTVFFVVEERYPVFSVGEQVVLRTEFGGEGKVHTVAGFSHPKDHDDCAYIRLEGCESYDWLPANRYQPANSDNRDEPFFAEWVSDNGPPDNWEVDADTMENLIVAILEEIGEGEPELIADLKSGEFKNCIHGNSGRLYLTIPKEE